MRQAVVELQQLGPLPSDGVVLSENLGELVATYERLIHSIEFPVTDEEARALVKVFGEGNCFGLEWTLMNLVESAPGWPLPDCLQNTSNKWIQRLLQSARNSGLL